MIKKIYSIEDRMLGGGPNHDVEFRLLKRSVVTKDDRGLTGAF